MTEIHYEYILVNQLLEGLKEERQTYMYDNLMSAKGQENQDDKFCSFAGDALDALDVEHQLDTLDLIALASKKDLNNFYH